METLVMLLICVPFVLALIPLACKSDKARAAMIYICGIIVAAMAIATAAMWIANGHTTMTFDLPGTEIFDKIILAGDFILMAVVIWLSFKWKKAIISLLSIVQTLLVAYVEVFGPAREEITKIRLDWLSIIMILIIGIVGVAIGIYAVGYMHGYIHHHTEFADRRRFFFAMIFLFYGAMFGLVTSMDLIWIYFFWEVTSVVSFLLIGYTRTEEAINNCFRALWMNLLGGCGLAAAITYGVYMEGTASLYAIIDNGVAGMIFPIAMLAFAALTKSAQFPFSGWLLGAMVAPTPSSALLHSATMVKAGVYMLVRISTAMNGNQVGTMVTLVGGFTFLAASVMAIAQSDGKKVLAYSTISNLGLITACAGLGTESATWAAMSLIVFHAISKSMLFQCVGAIENATHSRDIEDMQGLIKRLPKLAFILMLGIAGMFLAPFGMLVSKWAALSSFVDAKSVLLVIFVCFGSGTTMFYWTKWLSKIIGTYETKQDDITQGNEYCSMFLHAILLVVACIAYPVITRSAIEPYIQEMYGSSTQVISSTNMTVMIIFLIAIVVIPTICYLFSKGVKDEPVLAYMAGENTGDNKHFLDARGEEKELVAANWYMTDWFGEDKVFKPSVIIGTVIIIVCLCMVIGGAF